ncbi:MAG: TIM-barrel domain-containing protein [Ginsengibacter sp.]
MSQQSKFLNQPLDIADDFYQLENEYFVTGGVSDFNPKKSEGKIQWNYHRWAMDWFFNKIDMHLLKQEAKQAPFQDYESHPVCRFSLSFINARTIRLRMKTTRTLQQEHPSLMLDGEPEVKGGWKMKDDPEKTIYKSEYGTLILNKNNFKLELFDAQGKLLTSTSSFEELEGMHSKKYPFLFIKRSSDYSRSIAASFSLLPDEKIVGCGESFTRLNKRGQKVVCWACDTQSTAARQMYKPVPFFMSSRGYGMFVHTTSPVTMDFGYAHDGSKTLFVGDDQLDMFFFIGSPKEILTEYTGITGKSSLPPLWSFGLWMSRFSYQSQKEVMMVADKLRKYSVPCDVIHIDAGWFQKGINCDFEFNKETFPDPKKMTTFLKQKGFRASLWQIPYFTPLNPIFDEVVKKKLYVQNGNGDVATEDAILDFSNPDTIEWYSKKIKALLRLGISVIKADFGEAAPLEGYYASGRSGYYEHNNYPLRYTQLVSKITREINHENLIWSRSSWAGGQRNPVHWGGDAEVSDAGMAGTLRGGLSLGLSGFSFWSHDIGGFSGAPKEELFKRWTFFGMFTSHSRVHGFPPREPWEFSNEFLKVFRKMVEIRYELMPYIFAQAALAAGNGWPMLKAMFFNYPDDPSTWHLDDQFMFGDDMLVAPIMEENTHSRKVYLPWGKWINYLTKERYEGAQWVSIKDAELPGIVLVRSGAVIPHIALAQSTAFMDWSKIELIVFSDDVFASAKGKWYQPVQKKLMDIEASFILGRWELNVPLDRKTKFIVKGFEG